MPRQKEGGRTLVQATGQQFTAPAACANTCGGFEEDQPAVAAKVLVHTVAGVGRPVPH